MYRHVEVRSDFDPYNDAGHTGVRYNGDNNHRKMNSDLDTIDIRIAEKMEMMKKTPNSDMDQDDVIFSPMIVFQLRAG